MEFNCNCEYCRENTYIWKINKETIWVEIPKNGSLALKQSKFKNRKKILKKNILNYNKGITVLRHPVGRFKSLLSHYFLFGYRKENGLDWLKKNNLNYNINNKNIADIVLDNFNLIKNISEPHHFNTQNSFIPDTFHDIKNDFYDIKDLNKITNHHINKSNSFTIHISNKNRERILELYEQDYILYNKFIK